MNDWIDDDGPEFIGVAILLIFYGGFWAAVGYLAARFVYQ